MKSIIPKANAKFHLEFMNTTIRPLVDNGREHEAAERMEEYCKRYPEMIHLYATWFGMDPAYCSNFEGGHMADDLTTYTILLQAVIDTAPHGA